MILQCNYSIDGFDCRPQKAVKLAVDSCMFSAMQIEFMDAKNGNTGKFNAVKL